MVRILARHAIEPFTESFFLYRLICWLAALNPAVWRHQRRTPRAVRMRMAMEELGPTFIKFGQALSTRVDALPDDIGQEIKKLQDDVPPCPLAQIKPMVEKSLKGPLQQFFSRFDDEPVASASIAQVYHAITHEGRHVAIKVRRPNIEDVVRDDIRILYFIASLVENNVPEWRRFKVRQVVDEFASTIRNEMNFQVEAARADKFRQNFANDPELKVPEVIWSLSSTSVLILEWVDGIPIDELASWNGLGGPDPDMISKNIGTIFFKQVFRDGYFHADQHPGNLLVQPDGTLIMIDFGIIGRVDMQTRLWLAHLLHGFLIHDYRKVAQVHLDAGYIPAHTNLDEFEEACRQIGEPIFGQPLKDISVGNLLAQLFKVTERFDMEVQPQLLLLQKTLITLEGVGREINPELNIWVLAEPLIRDWMSEHLGLMGKLRSAQQGTSDLLHTLGLMPEMVRTGLERLVRDQMQLRLHPDSLTTLERHMRAGFRSQNATVTGGFLLLAAVILLVNDLSILLYGPLLLLSYISFQQGSRMGR
ncbi:MAG: 2-polyprenylphenol 6-hydroxylase [Magnetococcales bacterium]|nr:2-polyprenylphenol 6-hydroxylase [Magnetococcales bacterium]